MTLFNIIQYAKPSKIKYAFYIRVKGKAEVPLLLDEVGRNRISVSNRTSKKRHNKYHAF